MNLSVVSPSSGMRSDSRKGSHSEGRSFAEKDASFTPKFLFQSVTSLCLTHGCAANGSYFKISKHHPLFFSVMRINSSFDKSNETQTIACSSYSIRLISFLVVSLTTS